MPANKSVNGDKTVSPKKNKAITNVNTKQSLNLKNKSLEYSTEDELCPPKSISSGSTDINKKKAQAIFKPKTAVPLNTGGKAPPSVVKQAKLSNNRVPVRKISEKSLSSTTAKSKKKSIFSPENTSKSEDDDDNPSKQITAKSNFPGLNKTARSNLKDVNSIRNNNTNKLMDKDKIVVKSSESSDSSTTSESSSSSESESQSSADSTPTLKKDTRQKKSVKKFSQFNKKENTDTSKNNSESDPESNNKPNVIRKLTRSASTRKSRHLVGKVASETESDGDSTKRSISKSPVKKAPIVTKGKSKNKRSDIKVPDPNIRVQPNNEIRKCPLDDCDSIGHLSGHLEKHFTIDACPLYHNLTSLKTKENLLDRKKRDEDAKKICNFSSSNVDMTKKQQQIAEQKANILKIKDIRNKFKPIISNNTITFENQKPPIGKEREPVLEGVVSDYDLQLFREAQALASENIEEELNGLPPSKGTKYILMGKFCMEVWYQSPYPADAARLPKLYICEFCLRYQKSEVGMKRHGVKCVWRHPPGDEIYRKGKLGVWQVDGKRHKQYCQHLCLLAKFFLDHKTLYYDVEPFLFYVMTLADSEGCHTVGYFSKVWFRIFYY